MNWLTGAYLIILLEIVFVSAQCPTIVSRASWGARSANTGVMSTPVDFVAIHHTAGLPCSTNAGCEQQMRRIQNMHMDDNSWADIGYNFCIGGNGLVYEGRGWGRQGAHAPGYNSRSIGICFIGRFILTLPTAVALNSAQSLIKCGVQQNQISSNYWLIGHRQAKVTECPGTALFNEIRNWPRFNNDIWP